MLRRVSWLEKLFGGSQTFHELDLPPVRLHALSNIQVVDLRAIDKVTDALGAAHRVAIEVYRTLPPPRSRLFVFAPAATEALLAIEPQALAKLTLPWREHIPQRSRQTSLDLVERSTGEIGLLVPHGALDRGVAALAATPIMAMPLDGPGSNDIVSTLGAPTTEKGYTIQLPRFAPDVCTVSGVPGIGVRWNEHLLLDLRRLATGDEMSLGVSFLGARFAIEKLQPFKRRTWIIAPWILADDPAASLERAANGARTAVDLHRPDRDQVVFDGEPSSELRAWVTELGLTISEKPFPLNDSMSLPYPQLATNLMLDYAMRGR